MIVGIKEKYCWLLLQIYLLLMTGFVLQGHMSSFVCNNLRVTFIFRGTTSLRCYVTRWGGGDLMKKRPCLGEMI